MRVVIFCHSIRSDWNHGNAHFLRGIATEFMRRGHDVHCYEPSDGWSAHHLRRDLGDDALDAFSEAYPQLRPRLYDPASIDIDAAVDDAAVVLVHEWNDPEIVARIGQARAGGGSFRLFFHDTHHRAATAPAEMQRFDLQHYDGVLAFGAAIAELYLRYGWARRSWTWHEAADHHVFRPLPRPADDAADRAADDAGDLIWIGNWGDGERTAELMGYFVEPARALRLRATAHGVRYPDEAVRRLADAGIRYRSYLPNYRAPLAYARHRVTIHVPRRAYVRALPGVPTIRPFEALACGIPLVSAPWEDAEGLFREGSDYLIARNGVEMRRHLRAVLNDDALARSLAEHGRRTILERHTCAHRVDELLHIVRSLGSRPRRQAVAT